MTGLRISDIQQLRWEHIVKTEDGYVMRIRTEKTDEEATLPISEEALAFCGENGKRDLLEKAREFDPFGHAGLTPSGIIRLDPPSGKIK